MMIKIKVNLLRFMMLWSIVAYTSPCFSITTKEQLIDKVIVSVDDQLIFYTDIESEYTFYQTQGKNLKEMPSKLQLLESSIVNKMLLAIAFQKGIKVKKEDIEKNLQARLESIIHQVGSIAKLEQQFGKSIEEIKKDLRENINEQLTIDRMRHAILEDITLVPQEVKQFYESLQPSEIPMCPTMVEAYRIIKYPTTMEHRKKSLEEVHIEIVQNGKSFLDIAKKISEDTTTVAKGGERGFYKLGELDPLYEKTALSLAPGEVSEVIETKDGFHLIQLIKKNKKQYNTRHILIKHPEHKETIDELIQTMQQIYEDIIHKKMTFNKAVVQYSMDDAAIKQRHGLFTDYEGRVVPLENLDANIRLTISKMQSGTIAPPMICTTATGEQAVAIIYVKELIPAHYANLEHNYEYFAELALVKKKQQFFEEWVEENKQKVIIKFDSDYELNKALKDRYSNN